MNQTILNILKSSDALQQWEMPDGFDYLKELEAITRLQPRLEAIVGHPLILDQSVQDASYYAELYFLQSVFDPEGNPHLVGIRFSAFGKLFTIWSSSTTDNLDEKTMGEIVFAVQADGYIYVNVDCLNEPYTGCNTSFEGNWWLRFFDYL